MKRVLLVLILLAVAAGFFWLGRLSRGPDTPGKLAAGTKVATPVADSPAHPLPALPTPAGPPTPMSATEWHQYHSVHDATLQANPDLAAGYQQLLKEMQAQQTDLDKAMVQADPKVAPLVAKVVALRQHVGATTASSATPSGQLSTISAAEWQELHAARLTALKTNPLLLPERQKLADKLRAFEHKLDAAMIKTDPTLAPVLAKLRATHPQSGITSTMPSANPTSPALHAAP